MIIKAYVIEADKLLTERISAERESRILIIKKILIISFFVVLLICVYKAVKILLSGALKKF